MIKIKILNMENALALSKILISQGIRYLTYSEPNVFGKIEYFFRIEDDGDVIAILDE